MNNDKRSVALITGVTGQDGTYLSRLLLDKGYLVVGVKRRTSLINTTRLDENGIFDHPNFRLEYGNMSDGSSLRRLLTKYQPNEIYNLAAQSHVRVSFEVPEETVDVVANGTLRLLEAYREVAPSARFYQASSSEMYGDNSEHPQNEETRMTPASPYACAKLFAHNLCRNYRESYKLHISCGILFNHETVAGAMPLIFKVGNFSDEIDIKPISEIVKWHTKQYSILPSIDEEKNIYQETSVETDLHVWDIKGWVKVKHASGYPHQRSEENKNPKFVIAKRGTVLATSSHEHIMENMESKKFGEIEIGDKISLINEFPTSSKTNEEQLDFFAPYLAGFIVGDGNLHSNNRIRLTSKNKDELKEFEEYWTSLGKPSSYTKGESGFKKGNVIWHLNLNAAADWIRNHVPDIYTESKHKRVPKKILNASCEVMRKFLEGYNKADGLKKNNCVYLFKNFTTNSATLALGLIYLLEKTTKQQINVNVEKVYKFNRESVYYHINILSDSKHSLAKSKEKYDLVIHNLNGGKGQREINKLTGISRKFIRKVAKENYIPSCIHSKAIENNLVKKVVEFPEYEGWFYDLETESGTFHCGVGYSHVHNSPLRGETFVTRKISIAAARIKKGLQTELKLGNLEAKRDWGHARDYVQAMWLMLQQEKPDDYVVATGETHTVREFAELTFREAGLDLYDYLQIDSRLFRPHEVPLLLGDANKAKHVLGWKPTVGFEELVKEMYENELAKQSR